MSLAIINSAMSGVERAALDWALESGLAQDGWCPHGRHADDAIIPRRYDLKETPLTKYSQALEWNIRDSQATLVLTLLPHLNGRIRRTFELAKQYRRPVLHLHKTLPLKELVEMLADLVDENQVETLHITGSTETEEFGADEFLRALFEKYAESGRFPWA